MRVILLFLALLMVPGCNSQQQSQSAPAQSQPQAVVRQAVFNTSDKSIETNGNLAVAVEKLDANAQGWDSITKISVETVSKSPYSAIGKLYKITGKVYKVEELPPSMGLKGQWSEIVMLARNENSPLGASTIDCIYSGSVDKIKSGQVATCSGYFIGTFESQNAMGGAVESYVFIGFAK